MGNTWFDVNITKDNAKKYDIYLLREEDSYVVHRVAIEGLQRANFCIIISLWAYCITRLLTICYNIICHNPYCNFSIDQP